MRNISICSRGVPGSPRYPRSSEIVGVTDTAIVAQSITLEAVNEGKEVHELVLFKTDLAPADLPVDEEGAVDERGAGLELIDEVEDVKPGETKSFVVDLKPGKYVIDVPWCPSSPVPARTSATMVVPIVGLIVVLYITRRGT